MPFIGKMSASLDTKHAFGIKFEARRGVRVVCGAALEKREGLFYLVPPDTI